MYILSTNPGAAGARTGIGRALEVAILCRATKVWQQRALRTSRTVGRTLIARRHVRCHVRCRVGASHGACTEYRARCGACFTVLVWCSCGVYTVLRKVLYGVYDAVLFWVRLSSVGPCVVRCLYGVGSERDLRSALLCLVALTEAFSKSVF